MPAATAAGDVAGAAVNAVVSRGVGGRRGAEHRRRGPVPAGLHGGHLDGAVAARGRGIGAERAGDLHAEHQAGGSEQVRVGGQHGEGLMEVDQLGELAGRARQWWPGAARAAGGGTARTARPCRGSRSAGSAAWSADRRGGPLDWAASAVSVLLLPQRHPALAERAVEGGLRAVAEAELAERRP